MASETPEPDIQNLDIPDQLPLLPVRDIVVFPYMVLPLFVGRDMSIKAIEAALAGNRMIFLATQKALDVENPAPDDIHSVGTIGIIMRMLKLPDERIKILVQGISKGRIQEYIQHEPYYSVRMVKIQDGKPAGPSLEAEAVMRTVKEQLERIVGLGKVLMPDVMVVIENLDDPGRLADMVVSNLGVKVDISQSVLEIEDPVARLKRVSEILSKEVDVLSMQQKIQAQAKGEMDKTQREYFLREQLKAIQKELGELDERGEEGSVKVAWVSPLTSRLLLVNRRGVRKLVASPEQLAALVKAGNLLLEAADLPFDEAMRQVRLRLDDVARAA